jgi:hypothetical protein
MLRMEFRVTLPGGRNYSSIANGQQYKRVVHDTLQPSHTRVQIEWTAPESR